MENLQLEINAFTHEVIMAYVQSKKKTEKDRTIKSTKQDETPKKELLSLTNSEIDTYSIQHII